MSDKTCATTILAQMGTSVGMLRAMVNGRDFAYDDHSIQFSFSGKRGVNKCVITLNGKDLYDMDFWYYNKRTYDMVKVKSFEDLYFDMLRDVFESYTGLYVSL